MQAIIGPGLWLLVEVDRDLATGDEIDLGDGSILARGRYRLTRNGEQKPPAGGKGTFPYFTRDLIGDVPEGENTVPFLLLNC